MLNSIRFKYRRYISAALLVFYGNAMLFNVAQAADTKSASESAAQGDYSQIKEIAKGVGSTTIGTFNSSERPDVNVYGADENRAYGKSHEPLMNGGSDQDIKQQGSFFKAQLKSDEESTEGKVFKALNGLYQSEEYHLRDRNNKELGENLTLVNQGDNAFLEEYSRLENDLANGTLCRVEVVQEEVKEIQKVSELNECIYSDNPVYWPGSCEVSRTLSIPAAESNTAGIPFTKVNGELRSTSTASISYPNALALRNQFSFKVESAANVSASLVVNNGLGDNHYIFLNGKRVSINNGGSLSQHLVDGVNTITASCNLGVVLPTSDDVAPVGNFTDLDEGNFCSSKNNGVIDGVVISGEFAWSSTGFASSSNRSENSRNATGSCPTGFQHVGFDTNMDRGYNDAAMAAKRCYRQYDEPVCQVVNPKILEYTDNPSEAEFLHWYEKLRAHIFNPGPANADSFLWPTRAESKNSGDEDIPLVDQYVEVPDNAGSSNDSRIKDNFNGGEMGSLRDWYGIPGCYFRGSGCLGDALPNTAFNRYRIFSDGRLSGRISRGSVHFWITIPDRHACVRSENFNSLGPCRAPTLHGALGMYERWRAAGTLQQFKNAGHALNTSSYSFGCGHQERTLQLVLNYQNAIETISEVPQNCVSGNNQFARALDGSMHYNLKGKAFPYTSSANPPSTTEWQCVDADPGRVHGTVIQSVATMPLVATSLTPMFPGDPNHPTQVCYKAVAPKYAVDISTVGRCADGTFSCWEMSVSKAHGVELDQPYFDAEPRRGLLDKVIGSVSPVRNALAINLNAGTVGDVAKINMCQSYIEDSSCSLKADVCTLVDPISGLCRLYERTYECLKDKEVVVQPAITKKVCESTVPCMTGGDEKCTYTDETNDDFARTAVLLSVAQFASEDQECGSAADISTCNMFNGQKQQCRYYVSAGLGSALPTNNCCSKPAGAPGPVAYVQVLYLASQTKYVQGVYTSIAQSVTSSGVWVDYVKPAGQAVATGAQAAYDAVANKFKSWFVSESTAAAQQVAPDVAANIASAASTEAASTGVFASINAGANFFMADVSAMLGNVLGDWIVEDVVRDQVTGEIIGEIGTEKAVNALASGSGVESTAIDSGVTEALGNAFGTFMAIYTAYKLTMLVNDILTACGEEEFEAAYKYNSGSCVVADKTSHGCNIFGCDSKRNHLCCFNSPLARIIHEQAKASGQHNMSSWKDTYDSGCPGFTYDEFANLDFNKIDLSEWIELLVGAGKLPDGTSASSSNYTDIDRLTRNVARNQEDFDPETSDIPNAADRASELVGYTSGSLEQHRSADRDMLLMADQYPIEHEFCGYVDGGDKAFDGHRGFVMYPDGSKNIVTQCSKDPNGNEYPVNVENCAPVLIEGQSYTPKTRYIVGKFGERHNLMLCQ